MTLDEVNEFLCFAPPDAQARVLAANRDARLGTCGYPANESAAAALAATELAIIVEGAMPDIWARRGMHRRAA